MLSGVGIWEIALLALLAILLFGAKKLPELARSAGKGMRQLKDSANDIKAPIDELSEIVEIDRVKDIAALRNPRTALARVLDDKPEDADEATASPKQAGS